MKITQQLGPIHENDKLYSVTLRPNSVIFPWDKFNKSWDTVNPDTILPYRSISSGGVPTDNDKIGGKEYQLYLSRHAMVEFGMVLFYYRYPRHILHNFEGNLIRICGWHVLMADVAQHEKIN